MQMLSLCWLVQRLRQTRHGQGPAWTLEELNGGEAGGEGRFRQCCGAHPGMGGGGSSEEPLIDPAPEDALLRPVSRLPIFTPHKVSTVHNAL